MITVLKSDKSGDKKAILLRIPNTLMSQLGEVIRGDQAPALVKLLEIGLSAHKASGDDIIINIEPPKKGRVAVAGSTVSEGESNLAKDLSKLMAPSAGFGKKRK